jgi:hypothetical protein
VSHAEWPKKHAPIQTGGVVYCPHKSVDIERYPPPVEWVSKRAEKL